VRMFLVLLAGLAVLPSAVAAQAGTSPALTMSVSSHKALYSYRVTLSGKLTGGVVAGRAVKIEAWTYGSSSPRVLAAVKTSSKGVWSFRVRPRVQTTYQARVGPTTSPQVTVGVAPAMSVALLANGRIRALVHGGRSFEGRFVELQTRSARGTWTTVGRKRLSSASIAVFAATLPTSTIRVAMSINQAGAGYLGAASHALAYRAERLTLTPSTFKVLFGHRFTLTGQLSNGRAGQHVTIVAQPYGRKAFVFAILTTDRFGGFSVNARPSIQTTYHAQFGGTRQSQAETIGVRPTITAHELSNGRVLARVKTASYLTGHLVQLQRLIGGKTWQTVAKRPLRANATATFRLLALPGSTVRVAMSVNQAGAGLLGSTSHPLLYRAV
jgi:hypothetical protein